MFCMKQIIFLRFTPFTLYVWLWVTSESTWSSKEGNELALLEDALILDEYYVSRYINNDVIPKNIKHKIRSYNTGTEDIVDICMSELLIELELVYLPKGKYCVYPRMVYSPPILDDRKWISIALLAISEQYATLIFSSQNGCRRPFWMTENHFRSHLWPFQINTQLFFHKMAAGGHFGWLKITFDRISRRFRSIRNFYLFDFFHKMAAGGHFGWPKITFDRISHHFRSIHNFDFFHKMAADGHFGWAKITFDRISRHFRSIHNFYLLDFFPQNGCRRPFWMTENHFRSHFSPFQINTQLFFSQNGCQGPFWMTENHFWSHFSPFQINT